MSQNLSCRSKTDIVDVFHLHAGKVEEAVEALGLLKQAMYAMGAGEPLRAVLTDGRSPLSELMAGELVENALFHDLRDAEQHLKDARAALGNFLRLLRGSCALYETREDCHHE